VSKRFRLQEGTTLKELIPGLLRNQAWGHPFWALRDLSFSVPPGETLGILGTNGSGKSTILKLIAGVAAPTSGRVIVRGRVSPLIQLGAGFHPDMTGRENVFLNASILGLRNRETHALFDQIVNFADIWPFIDTPVKRYSSGMYLRLAFAVAAHCRPDILAIDEILAVGDASFAAKCLERIRQFQDQGVTIVLVSPSTQLVRALCHRAMIIESGSVRAIGDAASIVAEYEALADALPPVPA
jgi:ABC-type polysaccharide/polyol phosphate transport system ATPase subunit